MKLVVVLSLGLALYGIGVVYFKQQNTPPKKVPTYKRQTVPDVFQRAFEEELVP